VGRNWREWYQGSGDRRLEVGSKWIRVTRVWRVFRGNRLTYQEQIRSLGMGRECKGCHLRIGHLSVERGLVWSRTHRDRKGWWSSSPLWVALDRGLMGRSRG
jgi:hypothetical protein